MTSFTFSAEQVKSAPPEVRRWIENEVARALAMQTTPAHDSSKMQVNALAACTIDEVAEIFSLISGNFLVTQVFFELARDTPITQSIPSLHALNLSDIQRHVQLADGHVLFECLSVISQALQRIRNDADACCLEEMSQAIFTFMKRLIGEFDSCASNWFLRILRAHLINQLTQMASQ
jgi:hypothetical protein